MAFSLLTTLSLLSGMLAGHMYGDGSPFRATLLVACAALCMYRAFQINKHGTRK